MAKVTGLLFQVFTSILVSIGLGTLVWLAWREVAYLFPFMTHDWQTIGWFHAVCVYWLARELIAMVTG